jgi:hypothetical protein
MFNSLWLELTSLGMASHGPRTLRHSPVAWSETVCVMQCANQFCKMQLQNAENCTVLVEFVAAVDLVVGDKPNHPSAQYHRPLLIGTNVLVVGGPNSGERLFIGSSHARVCLTGN